MEEVDYEEDDGLMEQDEADYSGNQEENLESETSNVHENSTNTDENLTEKAEKYDGSSVSNTLFLSRYAPNVTREDLYSVLSKFGKIRFIDMKGRFSYIEFTELSSAIAAKAALHHSGPMLGSSYLGLIADFKKSSSSDKVLSFLSNCACAFFHCINNLNYKRRIELVSKMEPYLLIAM